MFCISSTLLVPLITESTSKRYRTTAWPDSLYNRAMARYQFTHLFHHYPMTESSQWLMSHHRSSITDWIFIAHQRQFSKSRLYIQLWVIKPWEIKQWTYILWTSSLSKDSLWSLDNRRCFGRNLSYVLDSTILTCTGRARLHSLCYIQGSLGVGWTSQGKGVFTPNCPIGL